MAESDKSTPANHAQQEFWNCVCIPLTRGYHALLDSCDYEQVAVYKWYAKPNRNNNVYAATNLKIDGSRKNRKTLFMHQLLFGVDAIGVDHKDRDGLNNRRENLRPCSQLENSRNKRHSSNRKTSRFHGVCWRKQGNCWVAQIMVNYKKLWLGRFSDEVEAALAYNAAALHHFGEFAALNDVQPALETSRQTA